MSRLILCSFLLEISCRQNSTFGHSESMTTISTLKNVNNAGCEVLEESRNLWAHGPLVTQRRDVLLGEGEEVRRLYAGLFKLRAHDW